MDTDYRQMELALRFLADHYREKPSLAEVARASGLSEWHFQRKFTRWAGVSPKRFMQSLAVEDLKTRLAESRSLLAAAYEAGLSSPARLHDLFVSLEAMTPGEFARAGAGLTIRYGVHPTPFGPAFLAITDRGICALEFIEEGGEEAVLARLRQQWPAAGPLPDPAQAAAILARVFAPRTAGDPPLPLLVRGTNFQIQVWRALLRVPAGCVLSYRDLAAAAGAPAAARAVGSALATNPIAYLIPCHRVIRDLGLPGDYRWGPARKLALLGWEAAAREAAAAATG